MTAGNVLIAIVVIAAVAGGVLVVLWGSPGKPPEPIFKYDSEQLPPTDPALIHYRQVMEIQTQFKELRAVAASPNGPGYASYQQPYGAGGPTEMDLNGRVFVGGDNLVLIYVQFRNEHELTEFGKITLNADPRCLALDGKGNLYIGTREHIYVDRAETSPETWPSLGPKADIRSIAVTPDGKDIFVADGGNAWVVHYDNTGKILGYIGRDEKTGEGKFHTELLHCFDVAVGADGLVRVVDPQKHAIQTYSLDGALQTSWEKSGGGIDGFHGCCNPTDIALLPDGNIVTCEKGGGVPRIKVYDPNGNLVSVVAPPGSFKGDSDRLDVAVDRDGRIIAIDPTRKTVRVFEKTAQTQPDTTSRPEPATRN
ncbi:MAG: NHL repeat-containing protein [Phycisphaerae bacterium]